VGKNPTDRGGIVPKRRMLTDGRGVPVSLAIEGANCHDLKMVRATIERIPAPATPQAVGLAIGDDDEVHDLLAEHSFIAHVRVRAEEAKALKLEPGFKARR
jgi:hypothetical protein